MSNIIGYTYEVDVHCVECAKKRFQAKNMDMPNYNPSDTDQHHIPYIIEDSEGNPVHPIFSTDEMLEIEHCGDCHAAIREE